MATARTARIESVATAGARARVFDLVLVDEEALGFVGGQYVIVDTGVDLPNGKRAKRAYSILSSDAEQRRFRIAVQRLDPGPGSTAMHGASAGDTLRFSGPWGKYVVDPAMEGDVLVLATDTGITAALGLVRGRAFDALRRRARLVWYSRPDDGFVPEAFVREELASAAALAVEPALPLGHPERPRDARSAVARHLPTPAAAFLSGDGAVVFPMRDALGAAGLDPARLRLEAFFNNPEKKAT
jgi:ferredoxin-NADP reductase